MPFPTFNYYHVLNETDKKELQEESLEMVPAMAFKKWRKNQSKFERKAEEWIHDDYDPMPIANKYALLEEVLFGLEQ